MKKLLLTIGVCLLAGCDIPGKQVIETAPPPLITQVSASPNSIDVNHLASQPTDPVDTNIVLSASVENLDASSFVTFTIFDPDGNPFLSGNLLDNGVYPDQVANDGKLAVIAHFHILKIDVGGYSIQIQATNSEGFKSNTEIQTLEVKNSNNHPPFITDLVMPDTISVPPSGDTSFVRITIVASDSDGLGDIVSVKLSSQKPDGTSSGQFNLYDDGGSVLYTQFGIPLASGDSVAGDGIYTITIPFTGTPEPPPTYRVFSFMATDRSGDHSNIITRRIYIVE